MSEIIFVTCNEFPELQPGDRILADRLIEKGVDVKAVPWNDPGWGNEEKSNFAGADIILIRSTWDYFMHVDKFSQWLDALSSFGNVLNRPSLMRWNMTKTYLGELEDAGVAIVPTRFCAPTPTAINDTIEKLEIDEAVVKPVVGGGASELTIIQKSDALSIQKAANRLTHSAMVQPLLSSVKTEGEISLIYFDGEFSHGVLKRPKSGDIRVQEEHGGTTKRINASAQMVAFGSKVLHACPGDTPCIARIDIVPIDGDFYVMEAELIEPELFFNYAPEQAEVFADLLVQKL